MLYVVTDRPSILPNNHKQFSIITSHQSDILVRIHRTTMTDRVLLPSAVTPVHYDLEIEPDFSLLKFQGSLDITVNVNGTMLLLLLTEFCNPPIYQVPLMQLLFTARRFKLRMHHSPMRLERLLLLWRSHITWITPLLPCASRNP